MPLVHSRPSRPLEEFGSGLYRLVDLELTCWPGSLQRCWSGSDEYREVVQCGFVDFEYLPVAKRIIATRSYESLCWPRHNRVLSPYFCALTGITNECLAASAVSFADVFSAVGEGDRILLANGDDVEILNENAIIHGISSSPLVGFDVREFLAQLLGVPVSACISSQLPGLVRDCDASSGHPHQALHDCWSVLRVLARGLGCSLVDLTHLPLG